MLRGHVFSQQTFANEAFALFINEFLAGNNGVIKGCELSNTVNSVTIGEGYFCIGGRFLQIISGETLENITSAGYYSLICEIDLTQENTTNELNQAVIKTISNGAGYPTLTQQDLNDGGDIYQYEFARFRITEAGIVSFTDRRSSLNFESIYSEIESIIAEIESGSIFIEKTNIVNDLTTGGSTKVASAETVKTLNTNKLDKTGGTISENLQVNGNFKSNTVTDIAR